MFKNASSDYLGCSLSEWLIKPQGWAIIYPQLWIFLVPISLCAQVCFPICFQYFGVAWPHSVIPSVRGEAEVVYLSLALEIFQCPGHFGYLILRPRTWWKRESGLHRIQDEALLFPNALGPSFPFSSANSLWPLFFSQYLYVFLCFRGKSFLTQKTGGWSHFPN